MILEESLEEAIDRLFQRMCTDLEILFGYAVPPTTILEHLMQSIPMEPIALSAGTVSDFLEFWNVLKVTNSTKSTISALIQRELDEVHNAISLVNQNNGTSL